MSRVTLSFAVERSKQIRELDSGRTKLTWKTVSSAMGKVLKLVGGVP